jgi:hypothetical protein
MKREKPDVAFVERPPEEDQGKKPRRISLQVTEDGSIDWSQITDKQRDQFFETISNDPDVLEKVASSIGDEEGVTDGQYVTPEHIKTALPYYAKGEARLMQFILNKKSKGLIKIPIATLEKFYEFDPKTMDTLAPDGAECINKDVIPNLPEWLIKFIFEMGPTFRFVGGLAAHSVVSTMALINYLQQMPQTIESSAVNMPSGANGGATGGPHKCPVGECGMGFNTAFDLGQHVVTHGRAS